MYSVELQDITKTYGTKKKPFLAVDRVSFSVKQGEVFGLIGADGAGKSTLFRILTTLLLADSGTAKVDGFDVVKDYKKIRHTVGYMPGRFSLYQDLTIEENLEFFATIFNTTIHENYHLIEDIYKQIEPFKTRRAGKLSGGMKQKLALCCALIHKPTVLFLDEPTTGVDPVSRKEFWEMLQRLKNQGITILVSTPYMDEATLCDRIGLIQKGKILKIDTPETIIGAFPKTLLAVQSKEMFRLLNDLREFEHTHSCFGFGEYHHLTLKIEIDQNAENLINLVRNYLERKKHQDLDIQVITLVANAKLIKLSKDAYETTINATGKHVYPGFIAPNSTLGLVEIDAVKASDDEVELGSFNPNVRSIIAYDANSKVIETVRPNGILIAQITPRGGRISGTSSIVQLDAWNWQDALIKENDGIHLNFPVTYSKTGDWAESRIIEVNKIYQKQLEELNHFFANAKAYNAEVAKERNLIFESMKGVFDGSQTLFIHSNKEKQIIDAVQFAKENGIKKMVIVGGFEAYKSSDLLQKNNIAVLLKRVHDMPESEDQDVDLPYKNAKLLTDKGIVVGLENSGDMERMQTRNLPFLAGTCAAYGLDKEQALQLITLNTAKILGIDSSFGSLELGKDATLFISEGDALDMRTNILINAFIQGRMIDLKTHQTQLHNKYKEKYGQK